MAKRKPATPKPVSSANPANPKTDKTETQDTQDATESPQATGQDSEKNRGNVANSVAESVENSQNAVLAREETRAQASNRWVLEGRRWEADTFRKDVIRQCRAKGMTKDEASEHAWKACLAQFPPPGIEPAAIDVPEVIPEVGRTPAEPVPEAIAAPVQADQGVSGLSNFPESWPKLPANAQLETEIAWVAANRLLVRSGTGVDLSRAMSPPPSYSALSWLETSILIPAKFADISVKATAETDDEREHIRREKFAIEEIRSILKEMLDAKGCFQTSGRTSV